MSDKKRWPWKTADEVAREIVSEMEQYCDMLMIAGSLRRLSNVVGDIEILYVPKFEQRQADLLTTVNCDLVSAWLDGQMKKGVIAMRPNVNGHLAWGEKNKLAIHVPSGIPVDFFCTTRENRWVSLVIRTGGKNTNLELTTSARRKGFSLQAYGSGVKNLRTGEVTAATSEKHVFELCGVAFSEPEHRL